MDVLITVLVFLYSSIFLVGFTGNLILVLATIHSRSLRSTCNILIGACCFFDLLLFTDIIAFVYSIFFETTQEFCFYININADFGAFASNACVLAIGIDRLIAITNPVKYKTIEFHKNKFILLFLLFPVSYALSLLYVGLGQRDPNRVVYCLLPESLGHAYDLFAITSFVINILVPPIYIYVYYRIKKSKKTSMQAVFKSLTVTVFLVVCGWMTTDLCGVLSVVVPMDPFLQKAIQLSCGTFIFTASSFTLLVYYKMSKDYRLAIRKMFGFKSQTTIERTPTYTVSKNVTRTLQ